MGEIAEMMLDGTMDPETGEFNFDGEDGPGFPMTGAEAAAWREEFGSPRPAPPEYLYGTWLYVASRMRKGALTMAQLREGSRNPVKVKKAVAAMRSCGLVFRAGDTYGLTHDGHEHLREAREPKPTVKFYPMEKA